MLGELLRLFHHHFALFYQTSKTNLKISFAVNNVLRCETMQPGLAIL